MSEDAEREELKSLGLKVPSPKEIKAYLDKYVVGQDEVKVALAVAVHSHYRRVQANVFSDGKLGVEIEKSNILMTGPTGTGKTLMAKTLAKMLGVPFAIADATTLTQAGYVGEDVENVVRYLWQNAGYSVSAAEIGIVYIDEIDKIASKTDNVSVSRDVSGEGVQQALLKIVEGTVCRFPPQGGRKHPEMKCVEVDTSNILFICGGAFVGLDKIAESRSGNRSIGFGPAKDDAGRSERGAASPEPEDFVKFGLIPEFVGRLPVVVSTKELTEADLVKVLKEPSNSLVRQYEELFRLDGIELSFRDSALAEIAKAALRRKTGARGLRAEFEKIVQNTLYDYAGSGKKTKLVVDAKFVRDRTGLKDAA
jgi:ATP-dependent Clp protease ATP-binding subunit ClpX